MMLVYALILCVTVSFAWILAIEPNVVKDVLIDYDEAGKLVIAPPNIEGEIYITDKDGNDVLLDENFEVSPNEVLPNSVIPFKLRLKNNTDAPAKVDISIVGVSTNRESILEVVFFSSTPTSGWGSNVPPSRYIQLGDATKNEQNNTYSLMLMSDLSLRSTDKENEKDYLEFSCYFYFDGETMVNEHQNANLTIGAFRVMQR